MTTHLAVLAQIVDLLASVPQLVIRLARPGELAADELGCVLFAAHEILLRPGLDPATARSTLLHELVHLVRGPALVEQAEAEERTVAAITAALLDERRPELLGQPGAERSAGSRTVAGLALDNQLGQPGAA